MAEYKKKNVKKLKSVKPKRSTVSDNYKVTRLDENSLADEIAVKSAKQAKAERKFEKKKEKYLKREVPSKRVVYAKKSAKELNGSPEASFRVINGNKAARQKRKIIAGAAAFLIISGIVLAQILSPTGLADLLRTTFASTGSGSGFPITTSGNDVEGLYNVDDCLAILSDSYFELYNKNGKELVSKQHNLSAPQLEVGYTRAALYDRAGTSVTFYDAGGEKFTAKIKGKIYNVGLSKSGAFAIAYSNEKSVASLDGYDRNNNKKFSYSLKTGLISSVAVSNNGNYTAAVCINAKDGQYVSDVKFFKKTSAPENNTEIKDLVYSVVPFENNKFLLTTAKEIILYDPDNGTKKTIISGTTLAVESDCKDSGFGAVIGSIGTGDESKLEIYKNTEEKTYDGKIISSPNKIEFNDKYIVAAKDNFIYAYNYGGKLLKTIDCGVSAKRFAIIGNKVYTVNNSSVLEAEIAKE